jgi:translation initiation factor 1
MHKNIFEMGPDFGDDWNSDNRERSDKRVSLEIKEPNRHQLYFAKERRRGKIVTIVKPFYLSKDDLKKLLKRLKKKLGTGGTIKDDNILEFQGDISTQLHRVLETLGYGVKSKL